MSAIMLSEAQKKALRILYRWRVKNYGARQIAGYGNAGLLSACNALVRKGLAGTTRTGHFFIAKAAEDLGAQLVAEFDAAKKDATP